MEITNGVLTQGGRTLLTNLPEQAGLIPDTHQIGAFLRFTHGEASDYWETAIGQVTDVSRWTACHNYEPFWMLPKAGTDPGAVPVASLYLLCEHSDASVTLIVALPDAVGHTRLQGDGQGGLTLVVETGDSQTHTNTGTVFVAHGPEPFQLLEAGAQSVAAHLKMGKLRVEKPTPGFIHQFGWCTWDAFYQDVSQDKVREGLESFRTLGIAPRYLILDDGWQSITAPKDASRQPKRLTGFESNQKFPGDLAPTVEMAKGDYGIETFLVWHAMGGYWAGVDGQALPGYHVRTTPRHYSEAVTGYAPDLIKWFEPDCDVVPPTHIHRFYQDYHRHLRLQGVDGVKIDNQSALEGLSEGMGGRVQMMRAYHEALEGAVAVHLDGNVINCMSCASEMLYGARASNLTRTSTDFWPNKPESHGLHLYTNAQVSAWFGHFVAPDWDMFQSGHPAGMYHAAGRAVGGCPVYVSDKPDAHNADVLRKLVLPDGTVLVADRPGVPTRDCLFHDPTQEDVLLKIQNVSHAAGIVGVFHARHGEGIGPITGQMRPSDVADILGASGREQFAVFAHFRNELRVLGRDEPWEITLDPLTAEIFTVVPLPRDKPLPRLIASIGIREMFNSGGAIFICTGGNAEEPAEINVSCAGTFVAWCARSPVAVNIGDTPAPFTFDAATGRLDVTVSGERTADLVYELQVAFA